MSQSGSRQIQPTRRNMRLLWAALIGALVMLAFLVEGLLLAQVALVGPAGAGIPIELMRYVLAAVAFMTGIGVLVARKLGAPDRWRVSVQNRGAEETQRQVRRDFTVWLVSMAMADSIGMYGLVLFVLGGQRIDFYLFAVPALMLMLMLRPDDGVRRI